MFSRSPRLLPTALTLLLCSLTACPAAEPADPAETCGNDALDEGEVCDGELLGDASCLGQGFAYGDLACSDRCQLDTSDCVEDPCWTYPCEPYGTFPGQVLLDLERDTGNAMARELGGDDGTMSLGDLFRRNEAHGGTLRGAMIFVTAGWCPYCAEEAETLEALYQANQDSGILILGLVVENNSGRPATTAFAESYAADHGWTFPTLAGSFPRSLWIPDDDAGAFPAHLFLDLRNMRITGRFTGVGHPKLMQHALTELAQGPRYGSDYAREADFDCAPGAGNEHEPNDLSSPEDGSTRPVALQGTLCPPLVAEGMLLDEDVIDLGQLAVGALIEVEMRAGSGAPTFPFFQVMRVNAAGTEASWTQLGPARLSTGSVRRQFVAEAAGRHVVIGFEGRAVSAMFYGDSQPPFDQSCCEGGAAYTYELSVASASLAATEPALVVDQSRSDTVDPSTLRIYPLSLTSGQKVAIAMTSANAAELDPYLVLLDTATSQVLAFNDDRDYANEVYDSEIVWTAPADQSLWVVASYYSALIREAPPGYGIQASTVP